MKRGILKKGIRMLEKELNERLEEDSGGSPRGIGSLEGNIVNLLKSGGPSLPRAHRVEALKSDYMARAMELRNTVAKEAGRQAKRLSPLRAHPAVARALVAGAAAVILLTALGFGSAYAMPGNPLYSVKRAGESIYLSLLRGNQRRAFAFAAFSQRRIRELEYVLTRDMRGWCYPLIEDCEGGLGRSYEHGKKLTADIFRAVTARLKVIAERLELLIKEALGNMTAEERAKTVKVMERLRIRLRIQSRERESFQEDSLKESEQRAGESMQEGKTTGGERTQEGAKQGQSEYMQEQPEGQHQQHHQQQQQQQQQDQGQPQQLEQQQQKYQEGQSRKN